MKNIITKAPIAALVACAALTALSLISDGMHGDFAAVNVISLIVKSCKKVVKKL